ncbi:MAG: HAD hydrolase-like protein [bacterium]|nr:HAD hydrolase-like protein [bacterium]
MDIRIKQFGITPAELLFVGDLPSDITAAKTVGARSAGISRPSPMGLASDFTKSPVDGQAARLKALKPDYFLDSLTDLLTVI